MIRPELTALDDDGLCPPERRDFAWRDYHRLAHRVTRPLPALKPVIYSAALASDGKWLATDLGSDRVCLWDLDERVKKYEFHGHGSVDRAPPLAFSPDGKLLVAGGADGLIRLWSVADGTELGTLDWQLTDDKPRHISALAFSADGNSLAAGGSYYDREKAKSDPDGRWRYPIIWAWDIGKRTGKLITSAARLKGHHIDQSGVNCLAYSTSGKLLAVGLTREGSVLILDAATGNEKQRFQSDGWMGAVAFSPDDKALAFGNSTSHVMVYDLEKGKLLHRLQGHLDHVGQLLFTPAGLLVSGSYDGTVRIWDVATGQEQLMLRCQGHVQGCATARRPATGRYHDKRNGALFVERATFARDARASKGESGYTGQSAVAFNPEERGWPWWVKTNGCAYGTSRSG